jgi:hypothetical protein
VQRKITYAGTVSRSFPEASELLRELADLPVPAKQVERLTRQIGQERVAQRDAEVAAFRELPLVEKFALPAGAPPPDLAVVMVDGGRLQILDRSAQPAAPESLPPAEAAVPTDTGTESPLVVAGATVADPSPALAATTTVAAEESWEEDKVTAGHWREDKIGLLLLMDSEVSKVDPCPEIPPAFLNATRIPKLARELNKHAKQSADAVGESADPEAEEEALREETAYQPPQVKKRKVVASRLKWPAFAPIVAAAAWALGFQGATRRAFVGDGSVNNWTMQRRFFGSFVPILDFIHALSYVFAAAMAGQSFAVGWGCYRRWIAWVWQGQVAQVIAAVAERQADLGLPEKNEAETSPRQVVARTLSYLRNQEDKMAYDEYRRQGLPITSSLMESTVKQVGRRVKGTEKFWSEEGAEAILQLRADQLSDDGPLEEFWQRRQEEATGQRRYRRSA